ncbi:hypothetical protein M2H05_16200 [Vibrio vulnificus]|nr:hypothetical protein [Vibrio vulnificus]EIA0778210.1 hypothetical protein [Vibrio cholerae]MCU8163749.1 hypothetical protein [Vibrio vulnificus]MCU8219998.1 hypothetical protein [Vibrio vulnificus]
MATITTIYNLDNDPRCAYELGLESGLDKKNHDIETIIGIGKRDLPKLSQSYIEKFMARNVALNQFQWIDHKDKAVVYFIFYVVTLLQRSTNKKRLEIPFDVCFRDINESLFYELSKKNLSFNRNKYSSESVIYIHDFFISERITQPEQEKFLMLLKDTFLSFKRSPFFKLLDPDNRERAVWTLQQIELKNRTVPAIAPTDDYYRLLSLAISLFIWDKNTDFKLSEDGRIGKSEFIHKLNLAWNQHKHRQYNKLNKIKAYQFEMKCDLQEKIEALTQHYSINKNTLIEKLINEAFAASKRVDGSKE